MLAVFASASAVPRPPLAKERALHAEINWPWDQSTPVAGDLSSLIFDAPTPEYDPFMHVKGTPSIIFGVMTGTETVEARAKSVLSTWMSIASSAGVQLASLILTIGAYAVYQ